MQKRTLGKTGLEAELTKECKRHESNLQGGIYSDNAASTQLFRSRVNAASAC